MKDINPNRPPQTAYGWARWGWKEPWGQLPKAWDFDWVALRIAADALGLKLPVTAGCFEHSPWDTSEWAVQAMAKPAGSIWNPTTVHRIEIAERLPVGFAAACVWHELVHCLQRERDPAAFDAVIWRAAGDYGPKALSEWPWEREAYLAMCNVKWCRPCH